MFKNVSAFKFDPDTKHALLHDSLGEILEEHGAPDPHATQWVKYGFAKPSCFGSSYVFDGSMGSRVICIRRSERVLPGKVIKQRLAEKVSDVEGKEKRKCHRKEIAEMKDTITAKLLPKAYIQSTDYLVMITKNYLLFDCSSVKMVDEMAVLLAEVLAEAGLVNHFRIRPIQGTDTSKWLKRIATDEHEYDEDGNCLSHFYKLDSGVLKGDGVVRLKDLEMDSEVGTAALSSKMHVIELTMAWGSNAGEDNADLHCSINDNLLIKRIKFSDVLLKQAREDSEDEGEVSHFDASVAIMAGLLDEFVTHLLDAVGRPEDEEESEGSLDDFEAGIKTVISDPLLRSAIVDAFEAEDILYDEAVAYVRETGKASISLLQRKLRIGYNRAAHLIEEMEEEGVVSPVDSAGSRKVLPPPASISQSDIDDFDKELEDEEL